MLKVSKMAETKIKAKYGLGLRFGHLGKLIVSTFYKKSYYFSMLHDMDKVLIKKVAETKINAQFKLLPFYDCEDSDKIERNNLSSKNSGFRLLAFNEIIDLLNNRAITDFDKNQDELADSSNEFKIFRRNTWIDWSGAITTRRSVFRFCVKSNE